MKKFKSDKNYLLRYCILNLIIFLGMGIILLIMRDNLFSFHFSKNWAIIFASTFLLCGIPSSLLHNCAHHNIKPNWLNTLVGEVIGSFMLYGYKGFRLGHLYHHKYPDNPLWDPHPPKGYKFLEFVMAPVKDTLKVIERGYYQYFKKTKESQRSIKVQTALFYLSGASRLFFWFTVFKLNGFIFFYLPVYFGNIIIFAHINYATHIIRKDGSSEIINLNHNAYYKIINYLSFNGYFHKSHHMRPQLFNPKKAKINDSLSYVSFTP